MNYSPACISSDRLETALADIHVLAKRIASSAYYLLISLDYHCGST
jgi:hypothetical protein